MSRGPWWYLAAAVLAPWVAAAALVLGAQSARAASPASCDVWDVTLEPSMVGVGADFCAAKRASWPYQDWSCTQTLGNATFSFTANGQSYTKTAFCPTFVPAVGDPESPASAASGAAASEESVAGIHGVLMALGSVALMGVGYLGGRHR